MPYAHTIRSVSDIPCAALLTLEYTFLMCYLFMPRSVYSLHSVHISKELYVHVTLHFLCCCEQRWAFALARLAHVAGDPGLARRALAMVHELHPFFVARRANGKPMGVRWKLNTDATPIAELGVPQPSSDAISGLVV